MLISEHGVREISILDLGQIVRCIQCQVESDLLSSKEPVGWLGQEMT